MADAMSRLPKVDRKIVLELAGVNDNNPWYYILNQESVVLCATAKGSPDVPSMMGSREILKANESNTLCQNLVQIVSAQEQFTNNDDGLLYKKGSIEGQFKGQCWKWFFMVIIDHGQQTIFDGSSETKRMYNEL